MNDLSAPLTDVEYERLDDFLLSVEHDDAVLNLSEFDGFITAVVSGPNTIMPSIWMSALWGGEDNAPVWDSVENYQFIFGRDDPRHELDARPDPAAAESTRRVAVGRSTEANQA